MELAIHSRMNFDNLWETTDEKAGEVTGDAAAVF